MRPTRVYFVANGALEVLGADDTTVIADIGEGDHVGESGVLKGRDRGNHVIVAAGAPAVLLRVEAAAFHALLARHAPVGAYFERHLVRLEAAST